MIREADEGQERLSVYIHLPFCRVKCTYCAFAISTDLRFEERYILALIEEMRRRLSESTSIVSLYFGGGTPSRTSSDSVERLGRELARYRRSEAAEVTLEANPEDVTRDAVNEWRDHLGVNRLSVGVQSFHDRELEPLGRQHGQAGAHEAIELAASLVPRISLDLILGLPHQSLESVASSTRQALDTGAGHISLYLLDLEPGSALDRRVGAGLVRLPSDEITAGMYRDVIHRAEDAGMHQYEVSNFARTGEAAVHNSRYWERKPYIGLGLGAHSFDGRRRSSNTRSIRDYIEAIERGEEPTDFSEVLTEEDVRHERLFLGMRQTKGLPLDEFRSLSGQDAEEWIAEGRSEGWIAEDDDRVRFTVEGLLLSDELLSELF